MMIYETDRNGKRLETIEELHERTGHSYKEIAERYHEKRQLCDAAMRAMQAHWFDILYTTEPIPFEKRHGILQEIDVLYTMLFGSSVDYVAYHGKHLEDIYKRLEGVTA